MLCLQGIFLYIMWCKKLIIIYTLLSIIIYTLHLQMSCFLKKRLHNSSTRDKKLDFELNIFIPLLALHAVLTNFWMKGSLVLLYLSSLTNSYSHCISFLNFTAFLRLQLHISYKLICHVDVYSGYLSEHKRWNAFLPCHIFVKEHHMYACM